MDIIIKEVKNKKDLKKFISFPYKLYKGNKYWIPPLRNDEFNILYKKENPAFEFCDVKLWLAYENEEVVGRIAGIINYRFIEKWKNKYARFGWIDFVDDENVSKALLNTVENWAREKGMEAVHGPLGFTDLDPEGMLIEGFDELGTIATIYNYPYYSKHLEKSGYSKDIDWIEFEVKVPEKVPEKIERIANIVEKKYKLTALQTKSSKDLKPYAKEIFKVLNDAFEPLYGVVPLTEKQVEKYTEHYMGIIPHKYISLILDESGKVAAFVITMPSLSKAFQKANGRLLPFGFIHILKALKNNDLVDLYLIAVRPDLQGKGVNAIILYKIIQTYIDNKIERAETNIELENNKKVQAQWKFFEHRQHKRRRCFIKHL
ncbi:MAG: GNAT family N-acetyltransferase [Candidatus Cloacimonetes bacterium]|nr:GNAT family N-acetyltransferase [Candidatus Cloacimonadota bacterium]